MIMPASVIVKWRTDAETDSCMQYDMTQRNLMLTANDDTLTRAHAVKATGYAIGTATTTLGGNDMNHFFITALASRIAKPTCVWGIGDSGTKNDKARAVRDAYYNFTGVRYTDVWLMLGDNAYNDGTGKQY